MIDPTHDATDRGQHPRTSDESRHAETFRPEVLNPRHDPRPFEPRQPYTRDCLQDGRHSVHEHDVDLLPPQVPGTNYRGEDDERKVVQREPDPGSAAARDEGHAMHPNATILVRTHR